MNTSADQHELNENIENGTNLKKRKISTPVSSKKKSTSLFDDEAAESGDEDFGSDSDEEDDSNYIEDGFLVREDELDDRTEDYMSSHLPKKKLQKLTKKHDIVLDEEDELLIQDSIIRSAEFKTAEGYSDDEGDGEIVPTMVNEEFSEARNNGQSSKRKAYFQNGDEDDDSDMDDFIVPEEGGDYASDDEEMREVQRQQKSLHNTQRRAGKRDGPSYDQIQEAMDIFGAGYDDFDEDDEEENEDEVAENDDHGNEEEQHAIGTGDADNAATEVTYKLSARDKKLIGKLRSRYERSQLVASFCTDKDEEIRRVDRPERFQDVMRGRGIPDDEERHNEAQWMAAKLTDNMFADRTLQKNGNLPVAPHLLQTSLVQHIEYVLKAFQVMFVC
jgi:hypothetical protein